MPIAGVTFSQIAGVTFSQCSWTGIAVLYILKMMRPAVPSGRSVFGVNLKGNPWLGEESPRFQQLLFSAAHILVILPSKFSVTQEDVLRLSVRENHK